MQHFMPGRHIDSDDGMPGATNAVTANADCLQVYDISANGSSTCVPDSSHASSNLHTRTDLPPFQAAPSELDQGPMEKLQKQVPGVQQEGEAVAVAKEMCDAQLKKKDAAIQLLKKRSAIPTYPKVCLPSICCCPYLVFSCCHSSVFGIHCCLH